ncbi:MAG TPA: DUF6797 domain-containing protein, partial [Planctomycetia bacterium]|nr:DUF6797 domain-containing protein [Planctomycetia bacterium]
ALALSQSPQKPDLGLFARPNLLAWCIVPFDSKQRDPETRAAMLAKMGFTKFAYDWRAEHVPTFDAEIAALRKRNIELSAFWFPADLGKDARAILSALERNKVKTQLWITLGDPAPKANSQAERVAATVRILKPIADEAARIGCVIGLYNHGNWFGEPENQLEVLSAMNAPGAGLVYNLHHGHDHLDRFEKLLPLMKDKLLCLNLNGMTPQGDRVGRKILPLAQGEEDERLLRLIATSGYRGPIGILGHTQDDAEARLMDNLDGLDWLLAKLGGRDPGPKPKPRTPVPVGKPAGVGAVSAPTPGWQAAGRPEYRTPPLTVECRATIHDPGAFNILVASDEKRSGLHWELFTFAGDGRLAAYLPGMKPDHVKSRASVVDGRPHDFAFHYAADRVRLYCDGALVGEETVSSGGAPGIAGEIAFGRLVEGGIGCEGRIEWVRIRNGLHETARGPAPPVADGNTTGLWVLSGADGKVVPDRSARGNAARPSLEIAETKTSNGPYAAADVARILETARAEGDANAGARVFADPKFACLSCHRIGAHGGAVGPALSDIAKCSPADQIVESLLFPRKLVKEGFAATAVLLADGSRRQGYKVRETAAELVLKDPGLGVELKIPTAEIEYRKDGVSLMPDNLVSSMRPEELRDIVKFLLTCDGKSAGAFTAHSHAPAKFAWKRDPLHPEYWPGWKLPVNRDRLYDFYAKQADYFRVQKPVPPLLAEFPGLDGGTLGHWGNQNEQVWVDGRWNETDLGSLQAGVFRSGRLTIPRAVCVRLGENGELAACFNPQTLTYDALWRGGFVRYSNVRHGFMDGIAPVGQMLPRPEGAPARDFKYLGFHRAGKRVFFAYRKDGTDYLDSPWVENGKFVRQVAPAASHPLKSLLAGSAPQWPQQFPVKAELGATKPYAVDHIPIPVSNPWKAIVFGGGHDFTPDGTGYVASMTGDVWRARGLGGDLQNVVWNRFAAGLHQLQGVSVRDGEVFVLGRDQITRLHDRNGDGEADFYECFSNAYETSPAGHDFICGLERDAAGAFYTASGNQGLLRISADGAKAEVLATGFRNPDGLGVASDGTITVPCSEGDWTPASMICRAEPGGHYGYRGLKGGKAPDPPLVYLPRGVDNSAGGQVEVTSSQWGPTKGSLVHLSHGAGGYFLLLREQVNGKWQGGVVPMPGEFRSGPHRARFHPVDGQLYVTGTAGWGTYTPDDGSFERVRYTGPAAQLPIAFHIHRNGVRIEFTEPLASAAASVAAEHFAQAWNYRYSAGYGSPEFSPSRPGVPGHDVWPVASAHVLADGKALFLEIPEIQPVNQLHLRLATGAEARQDLFLTVNELGPDFTDYPGYVRRAKTIAPHPLLADVRNLANAKPNPWKGKIPGAREVRIEAGKNLTYATRSVKVKAGEPLKLTFINPDVVPHNWVLIKPGTLPKVGDLANKIVSDPDAAARQYVPRSPDVLFYTDVVFPEDRGIIHFRAPAAKGRYPYLCTFPGHWMVMNGEMIVE